MFLEESKRIHEILEGLNLCKGSVVFDLGSSNEEVRQQIRPFIDYYVFLPLRRNGVKVVHIDAKKQKGVDIVCDLCDPDSVAKIKEIGSADVVICASLLEHIEDRNLALTLIKDLIKYRGVIILTVPFVYGYHDDPIDTLYRPSNNELEELLPKEEYTILISEILEIYSESCFIRRGLKGSILNKLTQKFKIFPSKVSLVVARKNTK